MARPRGKSGKPHGKAALAALELYDSGMRNLAEIAAIVGCARQTVAEAIKRWRRDESLDDLYAELRRHIKDTSADYVEIGYKLGDVEHVVAFMDGNDYLKWATLLGLLSELGLRLRLEEIPKATGDDDKTWSLTERDEYKMPKDNA